MQTIDSMVYFNILMDRMEVSREMSQQPQSSLVWVQMQVVSSPSWPHLTVSIPLTHLQEALMKKPQQKLTRTSLYLKFWKGLNMDFLQHFFVTVSFNQEGKMPYSY